MTSNPLRSGALRAIRWSTVRSWGAQIISLIVLLVVARLIPPAEFGLYSIASAIVFLLASVADQGLSAALVQRKELDEYHRHTVFWTSVSAAMVFAGLIALGAGPIASLFDAPRLAGVLRAIALVLPLMSATAVINAFLVRDLDFRAATIASTSSALLGGVVGIAMAFAGYGVWSLIGQALAGNVVGLWLFIRLQHFRPRLIFSIPHLRELWRFGLLALSGDLLSQLNQRIMVLLIGANLTPQAVGFFGVGRRLIEMVQFSITAPVAQVAMPVFSRMQDERARVQRVFLNGLQVLAALTSPVFALIAIFSPDLTLVLLGPQWTDASPVLTFLAIAGAIEALTWYMSAVLIAMGRPGLRLLMPIINLATAAAVFFATYRFGIGAIAMALATRAFLLSPITFTLVCRVLHLRMREIARTLATLLPPMSGLVAAGFACHYLLSALHPFAALVAGGVLASAIYWLMILLLTPELKDRMVDILPQKRVSMFGN